MVNAARARDDIGRLVRRGLPVPEFAQAVGAVILRAVPAEGTCLMTLDPATLLPTAEFAENGLPAPELLRLVEIEVREPDFNKWTQLARAEHAAASLSQATAGDLDRSLRQREIRRPAGFGDELRAVLGGWGALTVFRDTAGPHFAAADVELVSSVADLVADGLRRGLLLDAARGGAEDVGLLLLDGDDEVTLANPAADRFLDDLGAGDRPGARLPLVVPAVARQARALDAVPARARARTRSGRWLVVRASLMADGTVAVLLEAARPAELAPLVADAYGFTDRERRVAELVARGLSTKQIAAHLHVTTYTVQDHLKSVFTKSGASSRGELVARMFVDHYVTANGLGRMHARNARTVGRGRRSPADHRARPARTSCGARADARIRCAGRPRQPIRHPIGGGGGRTPTRQEARSFRGRRDARLVDNTARAPGPRRHGDRP